MSLKAYGMLLDLVTFHWVNIRKLEFSFICKGVESESIIDKNFNVKEQMEKFLASGGKIFACGTCLKLRYEEGSPLCPLSTMQDLMNIVEESDKFVLF